MQGIEIPIGAPLGQLDKDLKGAESKLKGFAAEASKTAGVLGGSTVKGANSAAFAMQNLGRVAQDAPFGFIGIQNNLNPLLESFQRLKAETGGTGSALKALGQSLIGPAGLGIALSVVSAAVLFYTQYQQRANKGAKEAVDANKELADSIKSISEVQTEGRSNASKDLSQLQSLYNATQNANIPAKERLKIADDLIKRYPKYLAGLTAEQVLAGKAASAYISLTNAILAKGYAQAAEENRQKLINQQLNAKVEITKEQAALDKSAAELSKRTAQKQATLDIQGQAALEGGISKTSKAVENSKNKINELNQVYKNAASEIKILDDVTQGLIKTFGADVVIDPEKIDKSNKDLKTQSDILKALDIDYKQIAADQQLIGSDVFTEKIKATKKALNDLIGIGVSTDSGIIKKLQSDLATLNQAAFTFNLKPQADKFSEQLRLTLIQFKVDAALIADEAKLKLDFIDPDQIDAAVKFAENAAKRIVDAFAPIKGPQQQSLIQFQFPSIEEKSALVIKELLNFNSQASEIINNGLVQTFAGIGNAIGDSLANGTNLAQNLGASLLNSLSSVLSQLGQLAIATAVGIEGIKISLRTLNPGPALLAGIALLALAGGVRALGNKVGGSGEAGNKGGGNFSAPIPQASSTISTSAAGSAQDFGGGRVVFEISGTNLIGVLNRAGAKLQRFGP